MGHYYPYMTFAEYIKTENPQTNKIRIKLFREGLKEKQCERCKLKEWQGVQIPLEVHHKDGNKKNNDIENLEILCPNCHALTDTYKGKNIKHAVVVESVDTKDLKSFGSDTIRVRVPSAAPRRYTVAGRLLQNLSYDKSE